MKSIISRIISFVMIVCLVISSAYVTSNAAEPSEKEYSNVLYDLKQDPEFKVGDYPISNNDYSLQVIQIAESVDKELFVYVYQPCNEHKALVATEIRMGFPKVNQDTTWRDYKLTLLNSEGVFCKYKVEGVAVDTAASVRYYDITAIFRPWDSTIDNPPDDGQTINSVVFEAAQRWTVMDMNGTTTYSMKKTDVVTITDKIVGRITYSDGFKLYQDYCDSHFVAFSCNYDIDKLMEADVFYTYQECVDTVVFGALGSSTYSTSGDPIPDVAELKHGEEGKNKGDGWFADSYKWQRIESISDFLADSDGDGKTDSDIVFSDGTVDKLKKQQWILRFVETDRSYVSDATTSMTYWTKVSNVSILRLKFESKGETYNLGVVDNKQTGPDSALGTVTPDIDFDFSFIEIPNLEKVIGNIKTILSIVLFVFLLIVIRPFKLIKKLFDKIFGDTKKQK